MMEKIPLVIHGFPFSNVLEKKSVSILNFTPTIKKFIASLKLAAAEHKTISLSAIQLGQPFRLFILSKQNLAKKKWFVEQPNLNQYEVILNPRIKKLSSLKEFGFEECPSFPGFTSRILRSTQITLNYLDESLLEREELFSEFAARVVQHELQHLDGQTILHYKVSRGDYTFAQEKGLTDDLTEQDAKYFEYLGKKIEKIDDDRKKRAVQVKRGGKGL